MEILKSDENPRCAATRLCKLETWLNRKRLRTNLSSTKLKNWKSQFATSNKEKMGLRKLPNVFTEQGVAMLSSVLNSGTAIAVNIQIIRIFTRIRETLLTNKDILLKVERLEKKVFQESEKSNKQEEDIQLIFNVLKQLLNPAQKERAPIGFKNKPTKK